MLKIFFYLLALSIINIGHFSDCTPTFLTDDITSPSIEITTTEQTTTEGNTTRENTTESNESTVTTTKAELTTAAVPEDSCKIPIYSLNGNYNLTELDSDVFIKQALLYIFTGCYNATNDIDDSYDYNTLDGLLLIAINLYADEIQRNPPDDIAASLAQIEKWLDIAERLRVNGSSAVFFKDIKEYLSKIYSNPLSDLNKTDFLNVC
jgi:hypothetical protein